MSNKTEKFGADDIDQNEDNTGLSIDEINQESDDEDLILSVEEPKTAENVSLWGVFLPFLCWNR